VTVGRLTKRVRREEDGAVLLLVGASLVLFLVLTAMVVNVGNWFTHKRQIQNRADAGAHAAGVEYANKWPACIQDADPGAKALASAAIIAEARKFAGDRTDPTAFNTEVADQPNTNIIINSTTYNVGTDYTDGASGATADPCYKHPAGVDSLTPTGGYWTDVRTREDNISRLMGALGLPLSHVGARARIEIHPQISGNKFIPLAVPEQLIVKAQVRYYNLCNAGSPTLVAQSDLFPLKDAYQTVATTTLWGPQGIAVDPNPTKDILPPGVDPTSIPLTVPADTSCSGVDYVPIGVEVRVAGRKVVNLNQTCAQLIAARFADCWTYISSIRAWSSGTAAPEPRVHQVTFSGNGATPCAPDTYFSRTASCSALVQAYVDWGDRDDGPLDVPGNFSVSVEGQTINPAGPVSGFWTGNVTDAGVASGANVIQLSYNWEDHDTSHSWRGDACKNGGGTPCKQSGTLNVQRTWVATDANSGTVDLVRTAGAAQISGGALPTPLDNIALGVAPGSQTIYPTIGLRSSIRAGQYRTLRFDNSQGNQSVDCEPAGGTGHDFLMFWKGCQPYYGPNQFVNGFWWNTATDSCPDKTAIFGAPNDARNPWQCVPKAPGFSPNVIMDGIMARLGNCDNIQPNSCQGNKYTCNVTNNYQAWQDGLEDPNRTRIMNLFIVPYGAFKNTGPQDGLPILAFAAFYVTGANGQGGAQNPCDTDPDGTGPEEADDPAAAGEVKGYFIEWVDNDPGPVDPIATCVVGQIIPCRAVLVR
jgi:Flp pilus assembly protein TadG